MGSNLVIFANFKISKIMWWVMVSIQQTTNLTLRNTPCLRAFGTSEKSSLSAFSLLIFRYFQNLKILTDCFSLWLFLLSLGILVFRSIFSEVKIKINVFKLRLNAASRNYSVAMPRFHADHYSGNTLR